MNTNFVIFVQQNFNVSHLETEICGYTNGVLNTVKVQVLFWGNDKKVIYESISMPQSKEQVTIIVGNHQGLLFNKKDAKYLTQIVDLWEKQEKGFNRVVSSAEKQFVINICSNF